MIRYIIHNRLGNQMFTYAFAKAYSRRCSDYNYIFSYLGSLTYFKLSFRDRYVNIILKFWFLIKKKLGVEVSNISLRDCELDYSNFSLKMKGSCDVIGTFQSEKYFLNVKNEIFNWFKLKRKYRIQFDRKYKTLFENNTVIAIHIRRTDYLNFIGELKIGGPDLTLPIRYYDECLKLIYQLEISQKKSFILLSDDIEFAKNNLSDKIKQMFPNDDVLVSNNNEIVDFQIILNADYCIIANSTFSWWATYLNIKKKKAYVPQFFLGFKIKREYPINVIPDDWIKVNVTE